MPRISRYICIFKTLNFSLCMQQRTQHCSMSPTFIFYFFPKGSRSVISNMSKHLDSQAVHWHSGTSQPRIPMLSPGCHIFCFSSKYCHLHKCYSTHNRPPGRLQTLISSLWFQQFRQFFTFVLIHSLRLKRLNLNSWKLQEITSKVLFRSKQITATLFWLSTELVICFQKAMRLVRHG